MRHCLGFACLFSAEMVARASPEADSTATVLLTRPAEVLAWFAPLALSFIPLFMLWKSVFRPPGHPAGRLVVLDVHGRHFVIDDPDIYLQWKVNSSLRLGRTS